MEQIKKGLRAAGVALALPLATALWSPLAAAEPAPAVRISNTLDAGQTARHDLPELRAGRYILTLSDSDLDLKLSVQRNAQPPVHYNSNLKRDEAEVLALNLNDGDVLQVTIAAEDNSAATAAYALSIRPALEDEHHVWPALASATEATNTATATADKADHLRSALRQLEQTDLDAHRARVAFALATHYYWEDFDVPRAIETASAAVAHYAKTDQPALHANARQLLAASIIEAANSKPTADTRGGLSGEAQALYDDALQHFEQAQNAHSALGNAYDVAMIENNIGLTHHYMGDLSYASRHYQIAADAMRELGETVGELNPRANLAVVDFEQGRLIPAREAFSRTLDLIQQKDEPEFYADTLNNLGAVNLELARYTEALDNFIAARDQHEHNDDQKGRARSVAGIGTTYAALGRTALAIDFLNQALTERTRLGDARGELSVRMHLGRLHNIAGQHQQALSQHKAAMPLAQRPMDRARLLAALARSQLETEDAITAKDSANQAIVAAQKNETVLTLGNAQRYLARAHLALDDIDAARRSIDQSLATLGQSRSPLNHALSLSVQAQVFAARNNWDAAKTSIEASLATIESIRARVDSPMLRAEYFAASQALYDQGIALFMRAAKHQDADERTVWSTQALLLSDRSKARILQDRIAQAWEQTPQSEAVHAQRRNLYAQLATAHGQAKAGQSDTTLTSLELQVRQLETTLRNTNAIAPSTQTLNLEQLAQFQAQLPTGTAIIDISIGADVSYAWLLDATHVESFALPGRAALTTMSEALLRSLATPANTPMQRERRHDLRARTHRQMQPLALASADHDRVIVIGDEALLSVHPRLLVSGKRDDDRTVFQTAPSLSMLVSHNAAPPRKATSSAPIAMIADPVYVSASANTKSDAALAPLPYSKTEADDILRTIDNPASLALIGSRASVEALTNQDLSTYRYLHFATHATVVPDYPALSSIELSRYNDEGDALTGALRLHEVYAMTLNAELVVLSACNTALGKITPGEGLIGPAHAFLSAGASSVIASLWAVPDSSTAALMARLYERITTLNEHPADALQHAQNEMANSEDWSDPYYWGAFVYIGS